MQQATRISGCTAAVAAALHPGARHECCWQARALHAPRRLLGSLGASGQGPGDQAACQVRSPGLLLQHAARTLARGVSWRAVACCACGRAERRGPAVGVTHSVDASRGRHDATSGRHLRRLLPSRAVQRRRRAQQRPLQAHPLNTLPSRQQAPTSAHATHARCQPPPLRQLRLLLRCHGSLPHRAGPV